MLNKTNRTILFTAILIISWATTAFAQNVASGEKVSVKSDAFTGKKTVSLSSLTIAPELQLDMESVIKTGATSPFEKEMEYATLTFVNSGKQSLRTSNLEVNFMVDGKIVKGGAASVRVKPQTEQIIAVVDISNLRKIGDGKTVQMKIGDTLFELDKKNINLIKDFAQAVRP